VFGVEQNPVASDGNPFRFAGMYWDNHTQTYNTPNRTMNPRTGRWSQPDPLFHAMHGNLQSCVIQSGNLFMFVMHNPVMFVDPLGLCAIIHGTIMSELLGFSPPSTPSTPASGSVYIISGDGVTRRIDLSRPIYVTDGTTTTQMNPTHPVYVRSGEVESTRLPNMVGGGHTAYTQFATMEIAILAFALTFHPQSTNQEWGAWLHRGRRPNGTGYIYWFGGVVEGTERSVNLRRNQVTQTTVGWIHTHPHSAGAAADLFSQSDVNFSTDTRMPGYLVTRSGSVMRAEVTSLTFTTNHTVPNNTLYNGSPFISVIFQDIFNRPPLAPPPRPTQ